MTIERSDDFKVTCGDCKFSFQGTCVHIKVQNLDYMKTVGRSYR